MKKYKLLPALLTISLILTEPFLAIQASAAPSDTDSASDSAESAEDAPAQTETIKIDTAEDFIKFADNCHLDSWSVNKIISLQKDIDLSGTAFETIPVFAGTFEGNGHTISGFRTADQGYVVGLFRYIQQGGMVRDLTVQGNVTATNEQECIGGICGINHGTIRTCSFRGIVSGQNTVGGICGTNYGTITNCLSYGRITGFYSTGGTVGVNHGIISFCRNSAGINNNADWVEEDDEMGTGIFFSFQASEDSIDLYSGVDTGGIAGYSDGQIECCENFGTIGYEHTGYNIGGIAGRQSGLVSLCTNGGEIYGRKDVGGIVGQMEPDIEVDEAQSLRNAVNKLHDLIEQTLDDMHASKDVLKSDLDDLGAYGDNALSSGDAMVSQMTDFVDDNMKQTQAITDRIDYVMDMIPGIMDDIVASEEAFGRANDAIGKLADDLDIMSAVDGPYNETDYDRIALLSTVGGQVSVNSRNPAEGDTVEITVTPESGYELDTDKFSVSGADGVSYTPAGAESTGGTYSFTMPAANVSVEAWFTASAAASTDITLSSNLSGSASCQKDDNDYTLTIRPDTGYDLNGDPVITVDGAPLTSEQLACVHMQDGSYQYSFTATSTPSAEITFVKLDKKDTLDVSTDSLQASIDELRQNAAQAERCMEELRALQEADPSDTSAIEAKAAELSDYLNQMSASATTALSECGTIYSVLAPYMQDAAEAAADDIEQATAEIHGMLDSLRSACQTIRVIFNHLSLQPDIRFATLGPEFDASREDLHQQLIGISDALKSLSDNAAGYSDIVNEDLKAVNDQLNVVFNLLADRLTDSTEASVEELYEDADAEDIESIRTGRAEFSVNNGIIKGDINIGGIAGSMAIDEEDPEDNAAGSVNYEVGSHFITKCIISDSVNNGYITAKKDGAGGIVGYMRHGIVANCEGYGNIESTEGDYVGGIAGESFTIIQDCYALCSVSGAKDVGGIAGYASTLQDCYAIVSTQATVGRVGAIAGEIADDADGNVSGNRYVGDDVYGIDNISYADMAEPISYNELLLSAEYLPTEFWHLKVTYRIEDTYLGTEEVKYGESLANLHYPKIPDREGFYGVWPDLSDQVMKGNLLIDGSYMDTVTVVESSEKAAGESAAWQKPYALVEQAFTQDTVLNAELSDREPPHEANGRSYVIYDISLDNSGIGDKDAFAIRLLNPYGEKVKIYGLTDGEWHELEGKVRGQYLQVDMTGPQESFCIIDTKIDVLLIIILTAAGIACAAILFLFVRMSKRMNGKIAARFKRRR